MIVNKDQALELAEKFLMVQLNRVVQRENIKVTNCGIDWDVTVETTPMISGQPKEIIEFQIRCDGRVHGWTVKSLSGKMKRGKELN